MKIPFDQFLFQPVIDLPENYEVYDFTKGYDPNRKRNSEYGIGRYAEDRKGMYNAELFTNGKSPRTIHMGIDIAAPVGTPVKAFFDGEVLFHGNNSAEGDYGFTLVTVHILGETPIYALFGHLSQRSHEFWAAKDMRTFKAGETIAWIGDKHENGGWNPHLHFQLSFKKPTGPDMPGAVSRENFESAKEIYPDPRLVLGEVYK